LSSNETSFDFPSSVTHGSSFYVWVLIELVRGVEKNNVPLIHGVQSFSWDLFLVIYLIHGPAVDQFPRDR
jgi:hypothetical protein